MKKNLNFSSIIANDRPLSFLTIENILNLDGPAPKAPIRQGETVG